jgi:hypothetical protein
MSWCHSKDVVPCYAQWKAELPLLQYVRSGSSLALRMHQTFWSKGLWQENLGRLKGSKDGGNTWEHPDWNFAEAYAAQLVTVAIAQFRLDKRHLQGLQGLQELTELTQSWNGHPGIHQVRSQCAEPRPDPRPTSKSKKTVGIGPFRHVFTHFTAGLL